MFRISCGVFIFLFSPSVPLSVFVYAFVESNVFFLFVLLMFKLELLLCVPPDVAFRNPFNLCNECACSCVFCVILGINIGHYHKQNVAETGVFSVG